MAKHNYTQYSKKNNVVENTEKVVETTIPEVELVEETVETVTLPKTVEGVVVNCAKLNVREEASLDSDVVAVLDAMSEIEINVNESTSEWFKICTATGIEGYCMRKFVDAYL